VEKVGGRGGDGGPPPPLGSQTRHHHTQKKKQPTNFDATYCAALGYAAGALIMHGRSGLMATCEGLARPTAQWDVGGYPLTGMMAIERRHGKDKPVIRKALVDLHGPAFRELAARRATWALHDCFRSPGPIQFSGVGGSQANTTLALELNGGVPVCIR
jgi:pyrophosphate--fructose-6-phosphate 1-phosphotransferase